MTKTHKPPAIYTIGHSNHPLDHFLDLLARHKIKTLVDVRSHPVSRFFPHFNRKRLEPAVVESGRKYLYLGDLLGGKPDNPAFVDTHGFVRYYRLAKTPAFQEGIVRLLEVSRRSRTAIMCAEEDPNTCHRRLLIAPVLLAHGADVLHIRRDNSVIPETELRGESKPPTEQSLFSDKTWKSALPIRIPKN